ncbi:PREDICTED: uncharacterized protein LOC104612228 isoform X2 [Nelumbo nucifera]|uniref:Uncharacterized protein LOC104612228 isoform X2 n=1 Tax=Nelumbo nucifera TaxID=4432 RepID=A0A1U8BLN1_NELNU|nr:PREDICTED: uncharacterized protein LOC104612228 isoform X2 [Nelumbo nucifera]
MGGKGLKGRGTAVKNIEGPRVVEGAVIGDLLQNDQVFFAPEPECSNPSLEGAKTDIQFTKMANSSRKEMLNYRRANPRRSQRIQNTILSTQTQDIEPVVENIDASESDEEGHECEKNTEAILGAKSLGDKVDYVIKLLESHDKMYQALMSKGADWFKTTFLAEVRSEVKKSKYKEMYIDSQKKIEILREENYQLGKKLENALGKLEAYEKGHIFCSEAIDKLRDAMLISSLAKTTETVLVRSPSKSDRSQVAKRKKIVNVDRKD